MVPILIGEATVRVVADANQFGQRLQAQVKQTGDTIERELGTRTKNAARDGAKGAEKEFTQASQKINGALAVVGSGLVARRIFSELKEATKAASDLGEATNVTGVIFKNSRAEIDDFVRSSTKLGLSEAAARSLTASLGGLLKNQGLAMDQSIEWSKRLTVLGADLGSTFNADPAEAIQAIGSALRGEQEPIRRFNVTLDDVSVRAKAVALGLADSAAGASKQARTMATLQLIMDQTTDAQGDFARTADDAANAQRRANAQLENAKAALGQGLIPVQLQVTKGLSAIATGFSELPGAAQSGFAFGGLALAATIPIAAVIGSVGKLRAALVASRVAALGLQGALVAGTALFAGAAINRFIQGLINDTDSLTVSIKELGRATDQELVREFRRLAAEGQGFNVFAQALDEGTVQARRLLDALKAAGQEGLGPFERMVTRAEEKERDLASSTDAATEAVGGLGDAASKAVSPFDRLEAAASRVNDAISDVLNPSLDAADATARVADAMDRIRELQASDQGAAGQRELAGAARDAQRAIFAQVETMVRLNQIAPSAVPQVLLERLQQLRRDVGPNLRAEIDQTIATLRANSGQFLTYAELRASRFGSLAERFGGRGRRPTGRQHGGEVLPGEVYQVGEAGPELAVFPRAGHVIPNDISAQLLEALRKMRGGNSVSISGAFPMDPRHFARAIQREQDWALR